MSKYRHKHKQDSNKHTAIIQRLKKTLREKQGLPLAYIQMIQIARSYTTNLRRHYLNNDSSMEEEQIQHLSDAIADLIQYEGLTNMEAIEALSLIMTGLVSYEITERPNDKNIILHDYEQLLQRGLLGITLSKLDLDLKPLKFNPKFNYYSDEIKNDNK